VVQPKLVVTSSPHLKTATTTPLLMGEVLLALLPVGLVSVVLFGPRALAIMGLTTAAAVAAEALYQKAAGKALTVTDGSAAVTGLLLALGMPPLVPLWVPVIGAGFAIIVVKQLYGGLGHNFMNPALTARAFLVAAWPMAMTTGWMAPFDGVTTATPLQVMKGLAQAPMAQPWELFLGLRAGSLGEVSVLALALGGGYLLWRRVIDWQIPAGFIGTVALVTWVFGGTRGLFTGDVVLHLLTGGLWLGALFMATDYVTSPVTRRGRLIMGVGGGLITALIRLWGGMPEGVTFGILLMNVATPLIDRFTVPRVFGQPKRAGKGGQGR